MTDQRCAPDDFRSVFETARAKGAHQPGSEFDAQRRDFFKAALEWADPADRRDAAALLREAISWSDWPGK